jgi:hypothetical protein
MTSVNRFVGRVALSKVGDKIGHALLPVQNGAEMGGRMAQLVFDSNDNLVLLSLDTFGSGLFVDSRIADLVAQDTIRIFASAGISLSL